MLTTGYFHDTIMAKFLTGSSLDFFGNNKFEHVIS